jgi:hypothetical protein
MINFDRAQQLAKEIITDNPNEYILNKIKELLEKEPLKLSEVLKQIEKSSGVYIVYEKEFKEEQFIYVGETDDLVRRLRGDISRGKKRYHTFLRKIAENKTENEIKETLERDYLFSFIKTKSKELAFVIEGVLIRIYKDQLWNTIKKYQK